MKITIEQLEFSLCVKEKINKIPNKKQSKFNKRWFKNQKCLFLIKNMI